MNRASSIARLALGVVVVACGLAMGPRASAQSEIRVLSEPGLRLFYETGFAAPHAFVCEGECRTSLLPGTYRFHAAAFDGGAYEARSDVEIPGPGVLSVGVRRRRGLRLLGYTLLAIVPAVAGVAWLPFVEEGPELNARVAPIVAVEALCFVGLGAGLVLVTRRDTMTVRFTPAFDLQR